MKRIQRQRTKGWRMPEGAVYVGRPTVFGNPFHVGEPCAQDGHAHDRAEVVDLYRRAWRFWDPAPLESLRGHDLACWCPLDKPCHADVLLELLAAST